MDGWELNKWRIEVAPPLSLKESELRFKRIAVQLLQVRSGARLLSQLAGTLIGLLLHLTETKSPYLPADNQLHAHSEARIGAFGHYQPQHYGPQVSLTTMGLNQAYRLRSSQALHWR